MKQHFISSCLVILFCITVLFAGCSSAKDTISDTPSENQEIQENIVQSSTEDLEINTSNIADLQKNMKDSVSPLSGQWDICVVDLKSDYEVSYQYRCSQDQKMISASLIKLFIMGAVYEQIEIGSIQEQDVYADLYRMITVSDNSSANKLTAILGNGNTEKGMKIINTFAEKIGCTHVKMNRLMLANNGLQNYVTASDCAKLLQQIYNGTCISKSSSAKMNTLLLKQEINDRIPYLLPKTSHVAHKTGDLSGLSCGDVGIIYTPDHDYILCCICNHTESDQEAYSAIRTISLAVHDYFQHR